MMPASHQVTMHTNEGQYIGGAPSTGSGPAVLKQLSLIQVLCKTYKRDTIFAGSLTKLLLKLEDEIVRSIAKQEKMEDKKSNYKQLARHFHSEFQTLKTS